MKLTIDLPDAQLAAIAAMARGLGLSMEEYIGRVLERQIVPDWLQHAWESSKQAGLDQLSPAEIDMEIAAARKARRESRLHPEL